MDPLFRLQQAQAQLNLPQSIVNRLTGRFKFVEQGVRRIETASGLGYPPLYVEPVLPVAASSVETGQIGVLYARTLPVEAGGRLEIWIQLSAPLVLFASKWTLQAVLAHEFMHYVELVRRFTRMDTASEEVSTTLFEAQYADKDILFDPLLLFKDKRLINLVKKKFPKGLMDDKLQNKTLKQWLERGLPAARLPPESNIARVKVISILNASFDPVLKTKLSELEQPAQKTS